MPWCSIVACFPTYEHGKKIKDIKACSFLPAATQMIYDMGLEQDLFTQLKCRHFS